MSRSVFWSHVFCAYMRNLMFFLAIMEAAWISG